MLKNGKLFGKINVIDFLVIIVIVLAIAAALVFFLMPRNQGDTLIMKYRIEEVDTFVASKVHIDDALYDDTFSIDLGYVTDVEIDDSISYTSSDDGIYKMGTKEGYYSMIITGEVQGKKTSLGAEIGGKKYGVGHSFVLRAGDAKLYLRVYDIQVKTDDGDTDRTSDGSKAVLTDANITFYTAEVEDFVADNVSEGDAVKKAGRKAVLGNIISVEKGEAKAFAETEEGLVPSAKEGFSSLKMNCSVKGELSDDGITIGGNLYSIGEEVDILAGSSRMTVIVYSID